MQRTDESPGALIERLDAAAQHLRTPCAGGEMRWRAWGRGPPLVLMHGGFGSWLHWVRNVQPLARHYRVVAPDLPGLGDSAALPEPVTPRMLGEVVSAGLRLVTGGEALRLVGFSFGGLVAGQVAAVLGPRVAALVLVGASGLGLPRPPLELMRRGPRMEPEALTAAHRYNLRALMLHDAGSLDDLALAVHARNDRNARLRSRRISLGDSLARALPEIAAAVDGIWGEHDATAGAHLPERAALLRRSHPACDFRIVPGAGHWVQFEAAPAFDDVLLELLARARGA